eukprot:CAMPEP_0172673940 /NCGR_PEP_ID=MMETSP1074-20121228/12461_1 /TAXON_ID=2916 /ORGANISM="Ceratium fusus, Strain PA161109" /LENGTH=148 /DNA_ID=CAMNT_0013491309 /DNA_START=53 /DNA_END=495 /DNA_ORIENTATION=+
MSESDSNVLLKRVCVGGTSALLFSIAIAMWLGEGARHVDTNAAMLDSSNMPQSGSAGAAMLQLNHHAMARALFHIPAVSPRSPARVCFNAGTTDVQIEEFCRHMPGRAKCIKKGAPFAQGQEELPCWEITANQTELPRIAARLPGAPG